MIHMLYITFHFLPRRMFTISNMTNQGEISAVYIAIRKSYFQCSSNIISKVYEALKCASTPLHSAMHTIMILVFL